MASPRSCLGFACALLAALVPAVGWSAGVQTREQHNEQALCLSKLPNPIIEVTAETSQEPSMQLMPSAKIPLLLRQASRNGVYLGLTRAAFQLTVRINNRQMALPGGRICSSPIYEIALSFSQINVTTAAELALDQCAHEFVISHELLHVHLHKEALTNTAISLQAELRKEYPPDYRNLESSGSFRLKQEDASVLMAWRTRELFSRLNTMHAKLDSPSEYAKAFDVCGGAITKLLPLGARPASIAQNTIK